METNVEGGEGGKIAQGGKGEIKAESEMNDDGLLRASQILNDEDKLHRQVMKVNEYILYERNITFFFNYVI